MKHLIKYKEFKNSHSETSEFEIPYAAVIPPPNDKIWNFIKSKIDKSPLWGFNLKDQEIKNAITADRKI